MLEVNIERKIFQSSTGAELEAIRNLQFSLPPQTFTCMVGPSGCGKTTTLRIILGLDADYEGTVVRPDNDRIAVVFQEPRLLPWRTVRQNVELCLPSELVGVSLENLLDQLGLSTMHDFYPSELSLGLARRVALARAFAMEPALLILDEPFVSLDDETAGRLRQLLMTVWGARPTTALMVTHNVQEAAELADTVLLLADRPTHIVSQMPISIPREQRSAAVVADLVQQMQALRA